MLGFTKFVGEWKTTGIPENNIRIDYSYAMHAATPWLYPANWLFTRLFWRIYMMRVLVNVRNRAWSNEPFQHARQRLASAISVILRFC